MKLAIIALGFIIAGCIGSGIGCYLALPNVCLTKDNLTHWTPECRTAINAQRNGRKY